MHFLALALAILLTHAPRAYAGGLGLGAQSGGEAKLDGLKVMGGVRLRVPIPTKADVDVFASSSYSQTASPGAPLLVYLHGFCLPDVEQQMYSVTATRADAGGGRIPREQTLSQFNDWSLEVAERGPFLYATPTAPHHTRKCALCNIGMDSPNVGDMLTVRFINSTLDRVAPAWSCPAWDGSDACCNPEFAGDSDDVEYVLDLIDAIKLRYNVDHDRVYLFGVATGGFMANRIACQAPDVFAAVATFAVSVWKESSRCAPPKGTATNVLNIHGEADLTVPITGGTNFAGVPFPGQDETVDTLASKFNCAPAISSPRGTLVLPVGDGSAQKEVDAKVATFGDCTGNVEVEQWTLPGVDHFMETPTSYAVFDAALEWLMSKNRRNSQSPE